MPFYNAPRSDFKRQLFLQRAAQTAAEDLLAGNLYLSANTIDALENTGLQFTNTYHQLAILLTARMTEVDGGEVELQQLQECLRDLWQVLRRRVRRQNQPVSVLGLYQLPGDGSQPKSGSRDAWIAMADAAIEGDGLAVAAGYPPVVNPDILELQTMLQALKNRVIAIANADRAFDLAQAAVAELRPTVDLLIRSVIRELRASLVALDEPSYRRIARSYGAEYIYSPGEPPEEDPIPEAAPIEEEPVGS